MHRCGTKIEREVEILAANQVHENQWIGLIAECCETILCLPPAPFME
jgi:hypothetical protein